MERGHVIVIAVVVAALALFGLKVWSDRSADSDLDGASGAAAQRLARAGGARGDLSDGSDVTSEGGAGRAGGGLRPGFSGGGGAAGTRGGVGPDGRGGTADSVRGGGAKAGGALGFSGSARVGSGTGSGAVAAGGGGAPHVGPSVQQRKNLVEFLSSQPATSPDLADLKNANGEDVALKLDRPEDIAKQGGQEKNVEEADSGDGIKITDATNIKFPNNVNPDGFTISFKVSPEWSGSDQTDNALLEMRGPNEWSNRVELVKNGEFLRFIVTPESGREVDISVRIADWQANQEHPIEASVKDGQTILSVDGQVVGRNDLGGAALRPSDSILVGGDHPGSSYGPLKGTIREFQITNAPKGG